MEKYSFGLGDRFGMEGKAQLSAVAEINRMGFPVVPVWNKSNREHELTGTTQESVRKEADEAVKALGWTSGYYVDADHINLATVDKFLTHSNFFTLDVAGSIGKTPESALKREFMEQYRESVGKRAPGYNLDQFANTYLVAIEEARKLYEYIRINNTEAFISEVSMDEVAEAQSPMDLYLILTELNRLGVQVDTVAPKFTGLFPKGVDYEGDVARFTQEFEEDLLAVRKVSEETGRSIPIKLSVHSGSDKFSIYPVIGTLLSRLDSGIHVKTAGTTWLEEVIGMARGGSEGLRLAKEIYVQGLARYDEMAGPYATVLHIDPSQLPPAGEVLTWKAERLVRTLTHDPSCREFNPHFRQLIHISYRIAAEMGDEFTGALVHYRTSIEEHVYTNLLARHLKRIFF